MREDYSYQRELLLFGQTLTSLDCHLVTLFTRHRQELLFSSYDTRLIYVICCQNNVVLRLFAGMIKLMQTMSARLVNITLFFLISTCTQNTYLLLVHHVSFPIPKLFIFIFHFFLISLLHLLKGLVNPVLKYFMYLFPFNT